MRRDQAERIADQLVIAQAAVSDNQDALAGVRLAAIMLAKIVSENGTIEPKTFLSKCGIEMGTFRRNRSMAFDGLVEPALKRQSER